MFKRPINQKNRTSARSHSRKGNFFYPPKFLPQKKTKQASDTISNIKPTKLSLNTRRKFKRVYTEKESFLRLKDGSIWPGTPVGAFSSIAGEVVFTTGMVGYVESLTDPSFAGQILVFTFPLLGNYGVPPPSRWESRRIQVRGAVFSHLAQNSSHWEGKKPLSAWFKEEGIPALAGVDTRALTQRIRQYGCTPGVIACQGNAPEFEDPNIENLVANVSPLRVTEIGKGKKRVVLVDCGAKENIVRSLVSRGIRVIRVPYDYDYTRLRTDGIVISNGPGDPARCVATIAILKKAYRMRRPIFGICLGSQLMGLAAGASTYKLPYGHRGQNQPCRIEGTDRCVLTSQNHGYAVRESTLPRDWRVTYRNANDVSVEGIAHKKLSFFSVQFHPEAHPGPNDTNYLFDEFVSLL